MFNSHRAQHTHPLQLLNFRNFFDLKLDEWNGNVKKGVDNDDDV